MDEIARGLYYGAMLLYLCGFAWLCVAKDPIRRSRATGIFWCALAVLTAAVLLYAVVRRGIPMDVPTQDALLRSWGLGLVLVFISAKYSERFLLLAVGLALALLFVFAYPMPLPSKMRMPPFLSKGLALPASVLVYDAAAVVFAYCFSLSVFSFFQKKPPEGQKSESASSKSVTVRIGDCALWGLFLFTVSQVLASIGNLIHHGTYWEWNPIHLVLVSVWMLYAGMVHLRWVNNISHKALPMAGVLGFFAILGFQVIRRL
jgi:hypothetical protein